MEHSAKNRETCCGGQHEELHDPVCGMTVTAESAHHAIHDDEAYYFCSARCLDKFRASPDAYLAVGLRDPVCGEVVPTQEG